MSKEALVILSEECAEVTQSVSKLLRFGLDSHKNRKDLNDEVGDVLAMIAILHYHDILDEDAIMKRVPVKLKKLKKYSDIEGLDDILENL